MAQQSCQLMIYVTNRANQDTPLSQFHFDQPTTRSELTSEADTMQTSIPPKYHASSRQHIRVPSVLKLLCYTQMVAIRLSPNPAQRRA